MSRKHFEDLASIVRESHNRSGYNEALWLYEELAAFCSYYSTNFDMDRFYKACFTEPFESPYNG